MTTRAGAGAWRLFTVLAAGAGVLLWVLAAHVGHRAGWVAPCVNTVSALMIRIESVDPAAPAARFRSTQVRTLVPHRVSGPACELAADLRLRLSWPVGEEPPEPGDVWRVDARLRPPAGFANPAGFDYERWLFSEGVAGSGYVRKAFRLSRSGAHWPVTIRQMVRDFLLGAPSEAGQVAGERANPPVWQHGGLLLALAIADGAAVTDSEWRLFRDTGTVHLIIVSGLHITLVTALGAIPGWLLGRLLLLRISAFPVRWCAAATGIASALGYTALTGYEVPAVRAVIFHAIGMVSLLLVRRIPPATVFFLAMGGTLVVMPLSVLSTGFWLSFAAVAILVAAEAAAWRAPGRWSPVPLFLRSQVLLSVGMVGWLALLVGSVSVTGPFINPLVVPLVSLAVLPLLLSGCLALPVSDALAAVLIGMADRLMGLTLALLDSAKNPPAWRTPVLDGDGMTVALIAGFLLVLPIHRRVRVLLVPIAMLPLLPSWQNLPAGEFTLDVLDVGQGSAALVATRHSVLVMDTGPRFPSGFDTGEAVVLPALADSPVREPAAVIVSHEDSDHAGGSAAILRAFPETLLFGSEPTRSIASTPSSATSAAVRCRGFPPWRTDGVRFQLLPGAGFPEFLDANDRSCALLVDNGEAAVLITGDTGSHAELLLLREIDAGTLRRLAVLVVAHHGSGTSSSRAFVRRTLPRFALISAGRHNPYGHPHPQVVARWQQAGARVLTTARQGALHWTSVSPGRVEGFREISPRYWRTTEST